MPKLIQRFYSNPAVMVPWCERVGLDPTRVAQAGFEIRHEGDQHLARYLLCPPPGEDEPKDERSLAVDVLPFPCNAHPDVPAIGTDEGLAADAGVSR